MPPFPAQNPKPGPVQCCNRLPGRDALKFPGHLFILAVLKMDDKKGSSGSIWHELANDHPGLFLHRNRPAHAGLEELVQADRGVFHPALSAT